MKFAALALAATVLVAGTAPAIAGDAPTSAPTLSYADLDLGTADGRAQLTQRFDQVARDKCGMVAGQKADYKARACYKNTGAEYRHFAESILTQYDHGQLGKKGGLAVR